MEDGTVDDHIRGTAALARPFLLALSNGVRVRVEPGERPLLRASTRLVAGARVFVRGLLKVPISSAPYAERGLIGTPESGQVLLSPEAFTEELEGHAGALGFQLFMLIATFLITQLLYVKLYFDALLWWLGSGEPPYIFSPAFSFVVLVVFSVWLGSVWSAWAERPR